MLHVINVFSSKGNSLTKNQKWKVIFHPTRALNQVAVTIPLLGKVDVKSN